MASQFKWNGLEELRRDLRNLPEDLADDASGIVNGAAEAARAFIDAEYARHEKSGNLRAGLVLTRMDTGKAAAGVVLKSRAKHAWLFDNGSQTRQWKSGKSTGAMWGRSAPRHTFVSKVIRAREQMYRTLAAMLESHGLKVTGSP